MSKIKNILALLCAVLLLTAVAFAASGEPSAEASGEASQEAAGPAEPVTTPETATEWIASAISCKSFSDEEVSEELVNEILAAGFQAPSAMNKQPWKFILLENQELKDTLVKGAPVLVIVAVPVEDFAMGGDSQFAAGCAAESMYLYAQAAGLGAHMYTAPCAMSINVSAESQALYGVPEGYEAAVVLAFGYYADYADAVSGATVRGEFDSFVTVVE